MHVFYITHNRDAVIDKLCITALPVDTEERIFGNDSQICMALSPADEMFGPYAHSCIDHRLYIPLDTGGIIEYI